MHGIQRKKNVKSNQKGEKEQKPRQNKRGQQNSFCTDKLWGGGEKISDDYHLPHHRQFKCTASFGAGRILNNLMLIVYNLPVTN